MESPQTILEWGSATFGSPSAEDLWIRCLKESSELLSAVNNNAPADNILDEIADVAIVHWQASQAAGLHVPAPRVRLDSPLSTLELAAGVNSCLANLVSARVHSQDPSGYVNYLCDQLCEWLDVLADRYGSDVQVLVNRKMLINRARTWGRDKNGSFQHVAAE